jgi:hypothetical protein
MRRLPTPLRERVGGVAFFFGDALKWVLWRRRAKTCAAKRTRLGGEDTAKEVY